MNAVGTNQFSVCITLIEVLHILIITLVVRTLDKPACRCIVSCYSQSDHWTVIQIESVLNQTFAKCPATNYQAPVPILQSTCKYLAGWGRSLIGKNGNPRIGKGALPVWKIILTRVSPAPDEDQELLVGEKHIGNICCGHHIPPTVGAEVQDKVLHVVPAETVDSRSEFSCCGCREFIQFHIGGLVIEHISRIEAVYRNFVANNCEIKQFPDPNSENPDIHFSSFHAQKLAAHTVCRNPHTGYILTVYSNYTVTGKNTNLLRGSAPYRFYNNNSVP